jgi:shikimate kinase
VFGARGDRYYDAVMWTSFVGFMGSGKTSVTRALCARTNRPLASTDELVAERAGATVAEIFTTRGVDVFRGLEYEVLSELDPVRNLVVDLGGGVVETPAAVALVRERGVVIWLDAPWPQLMHRLDTPAQRSQRPLVEALGWSGLEDLHRRRRRLYAAAADFRLQVGDGPTDQLAQTAMLRSLIWERRREGGSR